MYDVRSVFRSLLLAFVMSLFMYLFFSSVIAVFVRSLFLSGFVSLVCYLCVCRPLFRSFFMYVFRYYSLYFVL